MSHSRGQAAFRELRPKPITELDLGYYLAGNGHHTVLESLYGAEKEVERTWERAQNGREVRSESVIITRTQEKASLTISSIFVGIVILLS